MQRRLAKILGFNVDLFSFSEAIQYVENKFDVNESAHVVTINPEMIETAGNIQFVKLILDNADLVVPDGVGIQIALGFQGIEQEKIAGIEFSEKLLYLCAKKGLPVALLGAKQEVLDGTVENMSKYFPDLKICYTQNGYFSKADEPRIMNELHNAKPRLVLVALGFPKQEVFISECMKNMKNTVFVGVGGSFDVWSGTVQRAPKAFQDLGLEWLYRLMKQPSRFTRIFPTLPLFLIKAIMNIEKDKKSV